MKNLKLDDASAFLSAQGVASKAEVQKVLNGFDASKPLYVHAFWPGDVLYQFIRLTAVGRPQLNRGSWYGLSGVKRSGVAIHDGLAGRMLHKFIVTQPFTALEGTAAAMAREWEFEIGGAGGATQIYVARRHAGHIDALGPAAEF